MKIFVSSTYLDLKEHRRAVRDAILQLGHHPICMEDFGSEPVEPKFAALDRLAECDVFVGIYAYRYGTIPKGDSRSVTEQEFDAACAGGITCFCYRVDPDANWTPKYTRTKNAKKYQAFLKKVDSFLYSKFTTDDDLAKRIAIDLRRDLPPEPVEIARDSNLPFRLKETRKASKALEVALRAVKQLESSYAKEARLNKKTRIKKRAIR